MGILYILSLSVHNNKNPIMCVSIVCSEKESSTRPGSLTAKPFSWKSIASELPVAQIQTTASKAVLLSLPPG